MQVWHGRLSILLHNMPPKGDPGPAAAGGVAVGAQAAAAQDGDNVARLMVDDEFRDEQRRLAAERANPFSQSVGTWV